MCWGTVETTRQKAELCTKEIHKTTLEKIGKRKNILHFFSTFSAKLCIFLAMLKYFYSSKIHIIFLTLPRTYLVLPERYTVLPKEMQKVSQAKGFSTAHFFSVCKIRWLSLQWVHVQLRSKPLLFVTESVWNSRACHTRRDYFSVIINSYLRTLYLKFFYKPETRIRAC